MTIRLKPTADEELTATSSMNLLQVIPTKEETICPPKTGQGFDIGLLGKKNNIRALGPMDATNVGQLQYGLNCSVTQAMIKIEAQHKQEAKSLNLKLK